MSAPDTNLEKQKERHKGPLGGMALGAIFVVIIMVIFGIWVLSAGDVPEGAEQQVDGRTGEVVEGE